MTADVGQVDKQARWIKLEVGVTPDLLLKPNARLDFLKVAAGADRVASSCPEPGGHLAAPDETRWRSAALASFHAASSSSRSQSPHLRPRRPNSRSSARKRP